MVLAQAGATEPWVIVVKRHFLTFLIVITALAILGGLVALWEGPRHGQDAVLIAGLGMGFLLVGCFCGLAAFDRPHLRFIVVGGWMFALLMILALPVCGWYNATYPWAYPYSRRTLEFIDNLACTGVIFAGLLCYAPVIAIPRLNALGKGLQFISILGLVVGAILLTVVTWSTPSDDETVSAMIGALVVGFGGGLCVFGVARFSRLKPQDLASSVSTTVRLFCPRCGMEQELAMGESACGRCQLRFVIDVEEPRCPQCHYNLHRLTSDRCPECGWLRSTSPAKT
jgi:hypothetical protein